MEHIITITLKKDGKEEPPVVFDLNGHQGDIMRRNEWNEAEFLIDYFQGVAMSKRIFGGLIKKLNGSS